MTRCVGALVVMALMVVACGGGGSCGGFADESIDVIQDLIDRIDGLESEDVEGAVNLLTDFEERATDIDQRAAAAGCPRDEYNDLMRQRVGRLDAETDAGRALIVQLVQGGYFTE